MAREAAEAAVNASYERGVLDTETRLAEEVAIVCKDYVMESWGVAMNRAGVPADSELRRDESIFFSNEYSGNSKYGPFYWATPSHLFSSC